jgi:TRAP-type transport system small permease protein
MPDRAERKIWDAALDAVNVAIEKLMSILLMAAVVIVLLQILMRHIGFPGATPWVNESIMIANVWLTYVGGAVLSRRDEHIALYAYKLFPQPVKIVCIVLARIIVLSTSALVAYYGVQIVTRQLNSYFVTLPGVPRSVGSIAIVIGFALITLYKLSDFIARRKALEPEKTEEAG